jgi:hypothetical protein
MEPSYYEILLKRVECGPEPLVSGMGGRPTFEDDRIHKWLAEMEWS